MITFQDFLTYHSENPKIYEMFERFTLQAIAAGRGHFGAHAVNERLRWYTAVEAQNDIFKVNNNYVPFYARLFEERNPNHKGFFRKRRSVADQLFGAVHHG